MTTVHTIKDLINLQDSLERQYQAVAELVERISIHDKHITVSADSGYNTHHFYKKDCPEIHTALLTALTEYRDNLGKRLGETRSLSSTLSNLVKNKEL